VHKQICNSFANFGFERWLVGLANVLQCAVGFPSSFLWVGRKKQNKFPSNLHCPVKKLNPFFIIYLYRICLSSVFLHLLPTRL
jgi:hypothetical protein